MVQSFMQKKNTPQPILRAVEHGVAPRPLAPLTRFALPTGLAVSLAMALVACGSGSKPVQATAERGGPVAATDSTANVRAATMPTSDYLVPAGGTGMPRPDVAPPPPLPIADAGAPVHTSLPSSRVQIPTPPPANTLTKYPIPVPPARIAGGLRAVEPALTVTKPK
jgi:hypothetical protein